MADADADAAEACCENSVCVPSFVSCIEMGFGFGTANDADDDADGPAATTTTRALCSVGSGFTCVADSACRFRRLVLSESAVAIGRYSFFSRAKPMVKPLGTACDFMRHVLRSRINCEKVMSHDKVGHVLSDDTLGIRVWWSDDGASHYQLSPLSSPETIVVVTAAE